MDENEQGHPTLESIKQLKAKFTDPAYKEDVIQIDAWETEIKELLIRDKLSDNPSMMGILKKFTDDVKDMNILLMNADSATLSSPERDRVLDKKKLYQDFLDLFNPNALRKAIEAVDSEVQAELDHAKNVV